MTSDDGLRARFASLRTQIDARAPSFETVLARGHTGECRGGFPWTVTAGVLAASALAILVWFARGPNPIRLPTATLLDWKSPTDFLLNTPDQALLRTVPRVGEAPSFLSPLPARVSPITRQSSLSHEVVS